jgi:hypothetical protein
MEVNDGVWGEEGTFVPARRRLRKRRQQIRSYLYSVYSFCGAFPLGTDISYDYSKEPLKNR